jgi:predicted Rossmann fold nucleotide-binding protein DprA/Smf involved in DNA uptake
VLAVPGDITAPGSAAPLLLLAEGARACTRPSDVLDLLPDVRPRRSVEAVAAQGGSAGTAATLSDAVLPAALQRALHRAGPRGLAVEDLALVHPGGAAALLVILTRARVAGVIEDVDGGVRLRGARLHARRVPSDRPPRPSVR